MKLFTISLTCLIIFSSSLKISTVCIQWFAIYTLQLGDIIEIIAPTDDKLHEKQLITYIDENEHKS